MAERIQVRSAVPFDRDDILAGRRLALAEHARDSDDVPLELWYLSPPRELDVMVWSGRYVVAVAGGRPVAGAGWEPLEDGTVLVRDLFIHPDHARRGLARRILDHIGRTAETLGYRLAGATGAMRALAPALAA